MALKDISNRMAKSPFADPGAQAARQIELLEHIAATNHAILLELQKQNADAQR